MDIFNSDKNGKSIEFLKENKNKSTYPNTYKKVEKFVSINAHLSTKDWKRVDTLFYPILLSYMSREMSEVEGYNIVESEMYYIFNKLKKHYEIYNFWVSDTSKRRSTSHKMLKNNVFPEQLYDEVKELHQMYDEIPNHIPFIELEDLAKFYDSYYMEDDNVLIQRNPPKTKSQKEYALAHIVHKSFPEISTTVYDVENRINKLLEIEPHSPNKFYISEFGDNNQGILYKYDTSIIKEHNKKLYEMFSVYVHNNDNKNRKLKVKEYKEFARILKENGVDDVTILDCARCISYMEAKTYMKNLIDIKKHLEPWEEQILRTYYYKEIENGGCFFNATNQFFNDVFIMKGITITNEIKEKINNIVIINHYPSYLRIYKLLMKEYVNGTLDL